LIEFNESLASELGVDTRGLEPDELAAVFAGNVLPLGAEPIAMAYAGHQFGNFVPQLGGGRAILLGEVVDRNGERRDIQLKGAGRTPFSRRGDGRAALAPVLREYLVSEAMHALGIPTTRALAAVSTGEPVFRDRQLPGAVLIRVASSHIRIGTFQYFAARGDIEAVERLSSYAIDRHFPEARASDRPRLALLEIVVERQALLVARWMHVGFIHGVMNTDNAALSGETIDFGPCAFIDSYDPAATFSAIDELGRYAYGNQPSIGNGILPGSPRPCFRCWIPTLSGRSNLRTRRSPRLPPAFRSIGLPACETSSGSPAVKKAVSTSPTPFSERCMKTLRTSH
jgi:serine/tyrosine/threonine adenylyltransferase